MGILVQSGVREIDKNQLRESVKTLKERTQTRQVQVTAEIKEKSEAKPESGEEKEGGKSSDENVGAIAGETRRSVDEKQTTSSSEGKEGGSSSSSKRLTPGEKLRDALVCFGKKPRHASHRLDQRTYEYRGDSKYREFRIKDGG